MYQCATSRFTTKLGLETSTGQDEVSCDVLDVYDEVLICEVKGGDAHLDRWKRAPERACGM